MSSGAEYMGTDAGAFAVDRSPVGKYFGNTLIDGILASIAYRDLFDYPVSLAELHRHLHGVCCSIEDVAHALQSSVRLRDALVTDGRYYALAGREELFELRRQRRESSEMLWEEARILAGQLASLPFVEMVGVTGSLAVDNADSEADIDFMLVSEGGRLWTVRAAARVLQLYFDRKFGSGNLCANYFLSMHALKLDSPGLYLAQELTQMVPLYGEDVYEKFRQYNSWADAYFPNAGIRMPIGGTVQPTFPMARRLVEGFLRSWPGMLLERWECRRKLWRYNETAFLMGKHSPYTSESTGHSRDRKQMIEDAFADRMASVKDSSTRLRILFGQAYHLYLDPKLWNSMQPFPPLGALYAAAVARDLGHVVRVHDSMLASSPTDWHKALQVHRPDVVVLYEDNFNYLTKMCLSNMRDAALGMIADARRRGAKVLVCSSDAADEPEPYLRAGADFVLAGEGEDTLRELLEMLQTGQSLDAAKLRGVAYLKPDMRLVTTPRRPVLRQLDELPMPAWDLIDLESYREIWQRRHGRTALNMVTTRGCPYHCNWCAKPIWGQRYNARSPESVVDEIKFLQARTKLDYLWFMDDLFGLKPGWVRQFARLLNAANIRIRFKALSRPDLLLRDGEIEALASAGSDVIWMGAESGSQKILDAMEKGTTVEQIAEASARLRDSGIRVGWFIQFGYPGESRRDIKATIDLIRRVMPDELGISVSYPLPGTPFYERVKQQLGQTTHWRDSEDLAMLFRGPFRSGFYRALHRYVHNDLRMRRAWREVLTAGVRGQGNTRPVWRSMGSFGLAAIRRAAAALQMSVLSRLPHGRTESLPTKLRPSEAALPSVQPND